MLQINIQGKQKILTAQQLNIVAREPETSQVKQLSAFDCHSSFGSVVRVTRVEKAIFFFKKEC